MSLETNSMHRLRAAFARMAGLLDGRDFAGEEMRSFASACHDALAEVETDRIDIIPRSRVHAWSVCLSRVADRLGGAHGWDPELGVIVREMQAEGAGGVRPSDTGGGGEAGFYRKGGSRVGVAEPNASSSPRVSDDDDDLVPVRLGQPDVERATLALAAERDAVAIERGRLRALLVRVEREIGAGFDVFNDSSLLGQIRHALAMTADSSWIGVSAPNPEAGPTGLDLVELGRVEPAPREEKEAPWMVNGRPIEVDDDDDDARGWMVNGRPVSPRDVDHGDAQAEAENPWTVNGAPIPELPRRVDHAKCKANLERERERYRRALGLLVDVSSVARKVVGYVDQEAETKR